MYFSRYRSLCLQFSVTSHFRFRILSMSGARNILNFSFRQSEQVASKLPHTPAFLRIFHLINGVRFSLFSSQKKVDREVELWYCSFEKDCVWFASLFLNEVCASPMYTFLMLGFSIVEMSAWYTIFSFKHSPFKGHWDAILQLHVRTVLSVSSVALSSFELCFLINCSILSVQL